MKKNKLLLFFFLFSYLLSAQDLLRTYSHIDGYNIIPKLILERKNDVVIPYYITKGEYKKAGVLFLDKSMNIDDVILFEGDGAYVINDIKESSSGNLLVSAEGYSDQGQESVYFLELNNKKIINEFIFNEDGNELDPFTIVEAQEDIIIGGFIKSRT